MATILPVGTLEHSRAPQALTGSPALSISLTSRRRTRTARHEAPPRPAVAEQEETPTVVFLLLLRPHSWELAAESKAPRPFPKLSPKRQNSETERNSPAPPLPPSRASIPGKPTPPRSPATPVPSPAPAYVPAIAGRRKRPSVSHQSSEKGAAGLGPSPPRAFFPATPGPISFVFFRLKAAAGAPTPSPLPAPGRACPLNCRSPVCRKSPTIFIGSDTGFICGDPAMHAWRLLSAAGQ